MPPLTTAPQFERVGELVADAPAHGGKAVTGGEPTGTGYQYPTTIVTGVGPGVRLVDEEQFGPVLPIIRVPRPRGDAYTPLAETGPRPTPGSSGPRRRVRKGRPGGAVG